MHVRWIVTWGAVLVVGAAPAAAQSLAEVARKEQARREAVRAPGKTYTNADLSPDPGAAPAPDLSSSVAPAVMSAESGEPDPVAVEGGEPPAVERDPLLPGGIDEAGWRRRAAGLRNRVASAQKALDAVSGPSEGNERQRARMAELRAEAEAALDRAQAALASFEREAQAHGVPAAWTR